MKEGIRCVHCHRFLVQNAAGSWGAPARWFSDDWPYRFLCDKDPDVEHRHQPETVSITEMIEELWEIIRG